MCQLWIVRHCIHLSPATILAIRYRTQTQRSAHSHCSVQQLLTPYHCTRTHMPRRLYISPVSDDDVVAVFRVNGQLKANTVLRLVGLPRTRARILATQLQRLSHTPYHRLVEIAPPAIAKHRNPYYALALSSPSTDRFDAGAVDNAAVPHDNGCTSSRTTATDTASMCSSLLTENSPVAPCGHTADDDDNTPVPSRPLCNICHAMDPTVVFMPCKHQLSCTTCWDNAKKRQRSVHNRNERLRMQLADSRTRRALFRPVCPWCQQAVVEEIHPFMS